MIEKLDGKYLSEAIKVLWNVGIKIQRHRVIDVFDKENHFKLIDMDVNGIRQKLLKMARARINYIIERGKDAPRGEVERLALYTQFMKDTLEAYNIYEDEDGELLYVTIEPEVLKHYRPDHWTRAESVWSIYDEDFIYEKASDEAKAIPELFWKLPEEEEVTQ